MKIVVLTQYFPPDPPGWISNDIAKELSRRGHEVKVLTTFPYYAQGRIADGYSQKFRHFEDHGPVRVRRVPIFPSHSGNALGRMANYLSFACSARFAKDFVKDADVIYVHGTPATVAEPARAWANSLRIPFVFHVLDIWPESVTESGFLPKPVMRFTEKVLTSWLSNVYETAAAVIAIAPTAQEMLVQRGVPRDKCHLIFNWSDEDVRNVRQMELPLSSDVGLTLIYAGNLGVYQDLETVIRAAHQMCKYDGFRLLIAGHGVIEGQLKRLVDDLGTKGCVTFLGRLDREEVAALYASADFQVVSLKDRAFFSATIPSKFQGGLAHGLPLITTVKGDVTRLVNEHGLGFSALPENVESLAAAFRRAYATSPAERLEFSRRALAFYETSLSRGSAIDKIEATLMTAAESAAYATRL